MGRCTTKAGDSCDPSSRMKTGKGPQSIGATQRRQKNSLTQPWNQPSPHTPPFCPTTRKNEEPRGGRMSMSTIAFIVHAKEPRTTADSHRQQLLDFHDEKLRRQRHALVLDGPRVPPTPLRLVETPPLLPVPRPLKGRPQGVTGGKVAQAPT